MALEVLRSRSTTDDPAAERLIGWLQQHQTSLNLDEGLLYYGFPRYRDVDDNLLVAKLLLLSPEHGLVLFETFSDSDPEPSEVERAFQSADSVFGQLYGKLFANKALRANPRTLSFRTDVCLFAPFMASAPSAPAGVTALTRTSEIQHFIASHATAVPESIFAEITATLDGSRVIPRPKKRDTSQLPNNSKGRLVSRLETALATFDNKQREGSTTSIGGPQRLRGLAGSGKTIVLTKKCALTHLDAPELKIGYTFYTKSLYQQIRRLITRFYRDEHDRDPDWSQIDVLHSWGGADPGIYSLACRRASVAPIPFIEANRARPGEAFDYVCSKLLDSATIEPAYDYLFIDEGQDYPASFLKLCARLTRHQRFIYAYDELQTIFQASAPMPSDIFGVDKSGMPSVKLERDIVLYKCYRNPLEILVCAHALGFGIYGKPVQMLENDEHWKDIGYEVASGQLEPKQHIKIRRPPENSLSFMSDAQSIDQMVQATAHDSYANEVASVVAAIRNDVNDGLRPDDIVVAVVDDRNVKNYLQDITTGLAEHNIRCNNIHGAFGLVDFQQEDRVTLTTVHKAKGNEGYMVYVMGADAVFHAPDKRNRNKLFTAMTRAKAWVRVSGVGDAAERCVVEIEKAKRHCPYLEFTYPSEKDLAIMKRDLADDAAIDMKAQRTLDKLTDDQLIAYMNRRKPTKK